MIPFPFQAGQIGYESQAAITGGTTQSLWIRPTGANGATTFTDSSPNNRTVTRTGTPTVSSTVTYDGDNSIRFAGSGDLSVANFPGFDFGTGDFRVRFKFRVDTVGPVTQHQLVDFRSAGFTTLGIIYTLNGTVRYYMAGSDRISSSAVVVANTDVTVDLRRIAGVNTLAINGTGVGGTYSPGPQTISGSTMTFGADYSHGSPLSGYMGQIIVEKG